MRRPERTRSASESQWREVNKTKEVRSKAGSRASLLDQVRMEMQWSLCTLCAGGWGREGAGGRGGSRRLQVFGEDSHGEDQGGVWVHQRGADGQ